MENRANTFDVVGIAGMGIMGTGIATLLAAKGKSVVFLGKDSGKFDEIKTGIEKKIKLSIRRKRVEPELAEAGLKRLKFTVKHEDLSRCNLIIEAVSEDKKKKEDFYKELNDYIGAEAVVCSNTSSFSIEELAKNFKQPKNFAGMHFMNPVPESKLVEIVSHANIDNMVIEKIKTFTEELGLFSVLVKDSPGFIVNRVLIPMIAQAANTLQSGVATAEDIDAAMRLGCSHPLGPLALADMIGLDVVKEELEQFLQAGVSNIGVPVIIEKLVSEGNFGRKSGKGFYTYGR
jgi:3-hydroxybutyryl-CoA dehydrogenase